MADDVQQKLEEEVLRRLALAPDHLKIAIPMSPLQAYVLIHQVQISMTADNMPEAANAFGEKLVAELTDFVVAQVPEAEASIRAGAWRVENCDSLRAQADKEAAASTRKVRKQTRREGFGKVKRTL